MKVAALGLGNSLDKDTEILHSSVVGTKSFGRIGDLISAWVEKNHAVSIKQSGDLRVLVQSLFQFAYPKEKPELGNIEFSVEDKKIFVAIRFPNETFKENATDFEKMLSQYWVNSDDCLMLKKILYSQDHVEVRLNQKLNLIEWRICRYLVPAEASPDESQFLALVDESDDITSEHGQYTEFGDLPYEKLLQEVYSSSKDKSGSGEFFQNGTSVQEEDESVRVKSEREFQDIDALVRASVNNSSEEELRRIRATKETVNGDPLVTISAQPQQVAVEKTKIFTGSKEDEKHIEVVSSQFMDQISDQFRAEQVELKDSLKDAIRNCKKKELEADKQVTFLAYKMKKLEALLRQKELANVKAQKENKVLNEKLAQHKPAQKDNQAKVFKDKALQMYTLLKQSKDENAVLEKELEELKTKERSESVIKDHGLSKAAETNAGNLQIEELSKKLERTNRALEAEKIKVKTLSERVTVAEKEAQGAGPMIEDLESKVEHTLKLAQQHKKETEQVKQKVVQSEAEKNKIKNELTKAQAQIQTLMKRQAA